VLGLIHYWRAKLRRRAVNSASAASDPARLTLSESKLRLLCPSLFVRTGVEGFMRCLFGDGLGARVIIRDVLEHGDSRAAVVLSVDPLFVACYCDDLDGVCVLRFPDEFSQGLQKSDRLLTVLNSISLDRPAERDEIATDIVQGELADPLYVDFWPLVAEFLTDDLEAVERRKRAISDDEYVRCQQLGEEHMRRFGGKARSGRPNPSSAPPIF
jgi:hypothetical protein